MPAATRRHFDGYDLRALEQHHAFVVERLLEEGDTDDLRWLLSIFDEKRLGDCFEACGARLSDRSRAFWSLVLNRTASRAPDHAKTMRDATWTP